MTYQFPPEIAAKIASFRHSAEATSLLDEISILKMLLQEAAKDKSGARLCIELATAIGRLSKLISLEAERAETLIHRNKLTQLVESLVDVLIVEFQGSPGWEDKIERVANQFGTLLIPTEQPDEQPG